MIQAFIGIGANLGDARDTVLQAVNRLSSIAGCQEVVASALFSSAPIDSSGNDYVNAVAQLQTHLTAQALLEALQAIELAFGRERPYRNAPRTLDLDVLLYGDAIIDTATLTVPHPRMTERAFVLLPLAQLAPALVIPGKGTISDWLPLGADQAITMLSVDG